MGDIETTITCPLGHKCREVKDGGVQQCAWYTRIAGKDPQSEKEVEEWRCAIAWTPILLVENAQTNRGQTAALESFRNDTVKQQENFTQLLFNGINQKQLEAKQ